jgi:hypothetical protein
VRCDWCYLRDQGVIVVWLCTRCDQQGTEQVCAPCVRDYWEGLVLSCRACTGHLAWLLHHRETGSRIWGIP